MYGAYIYFLEWDEGHGGRSQGMEVEIREEASGHRADSTLLLVNNTAVYPVAGKLLVFFGFYVSFDNNLELE